jgi:hypothetical protein
MISRSSTEACTVAKFQNTRLSSGVAALPATHKPELTGSNPPEPVCGSPGPLHMSLSTYYITRVAGRRASCLLRPRRRPLRLAQPNRAMPSAHSSPRADVTFAYLRPNRVSSKGTCLLIGLLLPLVIS